MNTKRPPITELKIGDLFRWDEKWDDKWGDKAYPDFTILDIKLEESSVKTSDDQRWWDYPSGLSSYRRVVEIEGFEI